MKVSATTVRYIKLGAGGRWENSLDRAELHFGYGSVSHELAVDCNRAKIIAHLIALGGSPQAAGRDAQEVADFYELDERCLWNHVRARSFVVDVYGARGHLGQT
ncbi:hypothetical protein [Bradyrhizobium shewense]|uniref:hypothetical protein n=1 Tax=Bradyrhizobium shewense TaxID=1761772 RepID=UPI00101AD612